MKNQFATYGISLSLRELKFEEPCLGYFSGKDKEVFVDNKFVQPPYNPNLTSKTWVRAPLWQQIIDRFWSFHNYMHCMGKFYYPIGSSPQDGEYESVEKVLDTALSVIRKKIISRQEE